MKKYSLFLALLILPMMAQAIPSECKLFRGDGSTLVGHCDTKDGITIFNSCAQSSCQISVEKVSSLGDSDSVCKDKTDVISVALVGHNVKTVAEIPLCQKAAASK